MEYTINSSAKLDIVLLINTAGIHLEVIQAALCCSVSAETEFGITSLVLACTSSQLIVYNIFSFRLYIGQYRIGRNIVVVEGAELEAAV